METIVVNRNHRGITNDPRNPFEGYSRMATNFDLLTDEYRAIPYRDSEDGNSSGDTIRIQNFTIALGAASTYKLFGLGVTSGTGRAEIYTKELTTGGATDLDDAGWNETANNASASGATSFNLFVYYAQVGLIFGAKSGTTIWAYEPTGGTAFDDAARSITYTNIGQGLVHSKDDILYIPYDNKIAKNNNGAWTDAALTLPEDLYITSIAEYGNYLAIACAPLSGSGKSVVFLWNRDSTLNTLSERIDWGEDILKVLDVVDGVLVGISLAGGNSRYTKDRVIFRQYIPGTGAVKFEELTGADSSTLLTAKQLHNNKLFFMMTLTINGTLREGTWSIGRSSVNEPFAIVHERTPNNDTALSSGVLYNFYNVGDYLFQAYNSSAAYAVSKTNDQSSFTASSIIETTINPNMPLGHRFLKKQLVAVAAFNELQGSGESLKLEYRVDGGAWVEVVTNDVDNTLTQEMVNVTAGDQFTSGREYEFRVTSTGGAVYTGLVYMYELLETSIGN